MLTELHQPSPDDRPSSVIPSSVLAIPRPSVNSSITVPTVRRSNILNLPTTLPLTLRYVLRRLGSPFVHSPTDESVRPRGPATKSLFGAMLPRPFLLTHDPTLHAADGLTKRYQLSTSLVTPPALQWIALYREKKLRKNLHANSTILSSPNFELPLSF